MRLEFFEPPMCCSTGLCGPSVDENLVRLNQDIESLKKKYQGIDIQRYMITQQPMKFRDNQAVYKLLQDNGKNILPITTVNGEVIKTHQYPSIEEIESKLK